MSGRGGLKRGEASRVQKDIRRATLRAIDSAVRVIKRNEPMAPALGGTAGP